jgi:hypothetical protein
VSEEWIIAERVHASASIKDARFDGEQKLLHILLIVGKAYYDQPSVPKLRRSRCASKPQLHK